MKTSGDRDLRKGKGRLWPKLLKCGHVERRTALQWSIRMGLSKKLPEKCDACIEADALKAMKKSAYDCLYGADPDDTED